jgi:hypothetical protein
VRSWFLLSIILLLSGTINLVAQDRCATVLSNKHIQKQFELPESTGVFEEWVQQKITEREQRNSLQLQATNAAKKSEATYKIPVVVHVIHNGEAIGVGANVSDARIISQLKVLNDDFNRLNADKINTPASFETLSGSMDLEFILAKSAPDGSATTGIIRINGERASWSVSLDPTLAELKSKSYWNSANYLNIWVTNLGDNYIGLAQYPTLTTGVTGLTGLGERLATTDGVVIDFTSFGVGSQDPSYNLGRTTTHEVAHFLGLRHIWGDENGCAADDFVTDTPLQGSASIDYCPVAGTVKTDACTTTSPGVMYQNYMDYTDDACMNLFTKGQVERMKAIIENAERRASLLVSPGLLPPSGQQEDLEITAINLTPATCNPNGLIQLTLKNNSPPSVTINSFKINYKVNQEPTLTQEYSNLFIPSGSTYLVALSVTLTAGVNLISIDVTAPNNFSDVNPSNSKAIVYTNLVTLTENIPHRENFDNSATHWKSLNPRGGTLWENVSTSFNQSGQFKGYNNPLIGEQAWLISPLLNFTFAQNPSLYFDYSYAWNGLKNDRLKILASTNCGQSFDKVLFNLAGSSLSIYTSSQDWFPQFTTDWNRGKYVNLTSLAGEPNVILAVVAENAGGNNIYIDNLEFYLTATPQIIDTYAIYWVTQGNSVLANISFDLPEPQPVKLIITDMTGKALLNATLTDVFHQTFTLPVDRSATGLYIVRLQIGARFYSSKVYLAP